MVGGTTMGRGDKGGRCEDRGDKTRDRGDKMAGHQELFTLPHRFLQDS
jgi:hypothetical protein